MAEATGWWEAYKEDLPPGYLALLTFEQTAERIDYFFPAIIPGLLQTEAYAQSILKQFAPTLLSKGQAKNRLAVRMQRQWHILERTPPPKIRAVFEESALKRFGGQAQLQYDQIMHLVRLAQLPNISLHVLHSSETAVWSTHGSLPFINLRFKDGQKDIVSFETYNDHINSSNRLEVTHYQAGFMHLKEKSLDAQSSIEFMNALAEKARRESNKVS